MSLLNGVKGNRTQCYELEMIWYTFGLLPFQFLPDKTPASTFAQFFIHVTRFHAYKKYCSY